MFMRNRGFVYLFAFGAVMLAAALACLPTTVVPTAAPTSAPQVIVVTATPEPQSLASPTASNGGLVTFTDQNKYFAIDVPGDWAYSQDVDTTNSNWYWDIFKAPDGHAAVESIVYDDGTAWTTANTGPTFRDWLHKFYSSTGKEGDIRITDDSTQKDGSERLTWSSKGSRRSGVTYVEVRKPTAGLMFTIWWDDGYSDQYKTLLDDVVTSYRNP
jgi:hypothetical protein